MRAQNFALTAIIFLFIFSASAFASQPETSKTYECGSKTFAGHFVAFCINHTDRSKNPDIVFQFHGLGGTETTWHHLEAFKTVRARWRAAGETGPTVISLSMGVFWVLTDVKSRGALLNVFHDAVLPYFEHKVGGLRNGRRLMLGESMGGFNASQFYLRYPTEFSKMAMLCPAFPTLPFDATKDQVREYIQRTGAHRISVFTMIKLIHREFSNASEWANHDVFSRVTTPDPQAPTLYISAADHDGYGFFEGDQKFAKLARDAGRPIEFEVIKGGHHCSMDPETLSEFLIH